MQWFIVPNLDCPISGGTHYNRMLIGALRTARIQCEVRSLDRAESVLTEAVAGDSIWVDSLHLDELPRLARAARPGTRLGMIAHYLPSLVSLGEGLGPEHLTPAEAAALKTAAMFLVSSPFMRGILRRLTGAGRPILHVEPGRSLAVPSTLPEPPPVRAVMVANLVPGKGIEAFLRSLTAKIQGTDKLYLDVVGGTAHDPPYAERCRAAASDPRIRGCVRFLGELPHEKSLGKMAASNLLISASQMESYGMALAEARAIGIPILALRGGHVASLVGQDSGGELLATTDDLVGACLMLCRNRAEHRRRMERARIRTLPVRPWSLAASEFRTQLVDLERTRWQDRIPEAERVHDGG